MRVRLVITAALAVAGLAAAPAGGARVFPVALGGGTLVVGSGVLDLGFDTVTVDVFAYRTAAGSVGRRYRIHWSGGTEVVAATCLRVDGGRALVGGIVVQTAVPSQLGIAANLAIDDRGVLGQPLRDRTIYGIGPGASTCPHSPAVIAGPWDTLVRGDYFIVGTPTG